MVRGSDYAPFFNFPEKVKIVQIKTVKRIAIKENTLYYNYQTTVYKKYDFALKEALLAVKPEDGFEFIFMEELPH